MQIARAKIIRPPMAMAMLEGSRFERRILRLSGTQYTISSANKKEISLREFTVSGQRRTRLTTAQSMLRRLLKTGLPRDRLNFLTSTSRDHGCALSERRRTEPRDALKQARHGNGNGSRDSGVSGQIWCDVARQSVPHGRADLRAGSRSGCFATLVGLTAVVSCLRQMGPTAS